MKTVQEDRYLYVFYRQVIGMSQYPWDRIQRLVPANRDFTVGSHTAYGFREQTVCRILRRPCKARGFRSADRRRGSSSWTLRHITDSDTRSLTVCGVRWTIQGYNQLLDPIINHTTVLIQLVLTP